VSVQRVFLCPFHGKPKPLRVSLESPGLENIPQVPGYRAKTGQNHDARKAVSTTVWVLKWSGGIFRSRSSKESVEKVLLCQFYYKPRLSGVGLESPGVQDIPQAPGNQAKIGQNHDARKAVSATIWVLMWSGAIFRPSSSKVTVQKVLLCLFHCKQRPSQVSLESPGLENISQVPGNRAKVTQNQVARKAVSATF